jgi:F0F1-type ATP synthase membrane subunit b/b'
MALFDDMLVSYRGAGTIATFLGGFVLVSLLLLSVLVLDPRLNGAMESSAAMIARQEREISHLTRELATMEAKHEQYIQRKKLQHELEGNRRAEQAARERLSVLSTRLEESGEELLQLQGRRRRYVQAYKEQIRSQAEGEVLPTLETRDGRVMESPRIVKVTPAGLQLRYQDGIVRVAVKDLPAGIRQRFQFSEEEAESYLLAEKIEVGELERHIERGVSEIQKATRRKRMEYLEDRIPFLKGRIKSLGKSANNLERKRYYDGRLMDQLRQQIGLAQKELAEAEPEFARLKAGGRAASEN